MGTILASAILAKVAAILQDRTNVTWTTDDLLGWLTSGQRAIVENKPNAYTKNESVALAAGTKQALPSQGLVLIDVIRNMGADGSTPGRAITVIDRDTLDVVYPDWHMATAAAEAKHYVYDVRDPKTFYVYPPQPSATTQNVEIIYSLMPAGVGSAAQAIVVDDIYEGPLIDYILYRCFSEDGVTPDPQKCLLHYQAFLSALGVKWRGEVRSNAGRKNSPPETVPLAAAEPAQG